METVQFKMHDGSSTIQRLQVHLPDQQRVTFSADGDLGQLLAADRLRKTTLTEWFTANQTIPLARDVLYLDFPSRFVWNSRERKWTIRNRGYAVGRLYFVNPSSGERYFLRTLLTKGSGAMSFEDLRTYNGVVYDTFKAACIAQGLYEDDDEWACALEEGQQFRQEINSDHCL